MTSKWTAEPLDPEASTQPEDHVILCYWCARKHWGFVDEFKGNAPLDDVFFARLEEVGKVQLSNGHRKLIKEALLEYGHPGPVGATPSQHRRAMLSIANHAHALLQEAERHGDSFKSWIEFHRTPPWIEKRGVEWWPQVASILQSLKEEADFALYLDRQLNDGDAEIAHRPRNRRVIALVGLCGHVYAHAGGRAKISNNLGKYQGHYAAFLKSIWDVIPSGQRPSSPNAFARTAIEYFAKCSVNKHDDTTPAKLDRMTRSPRKRSLS